MTNALPVLCIPATKLAQCRELTAATVDGYRSSSRPVTSVISDATLVEECDLVHRMAIPVRD